MAYRVVIAEDFKMIRQVFEDAVKQADDYELLAAFPTAEEASEKVTEELREFLAASPEEAELEGGDLLFAAVNVLRMKGVDPEMALTRSVDKFVARFTKVENVVLSSGKQMKDLSIEELDAIYEEVKKEERSALSARKDG